MQRASSSFVTVNTTRLGFVIHDITISLQLVTNLPIDELEERVFVHRIVEVGRHISLLLKPGPRHIKLVLKVVLWMKHLIHSYHTLRHLILVLGRLQHLGKVSKAITIEQV